MRVLIVTDNTLAAEALRRVLRHAPACRVIGYVNARVPCADMVAQAQPDVVVLDESVSTLGTLTRIREVRGEAADATIVLLTARMDPDWLAEATDAGIDAAIARTAHPTAVGVLVREVAAGNVFHAFAPAASRRQPEPIPVDLTARELEILQRVAAGASERDHRDGPVRDRADGQVPPLEHLPEARRRQPDAGEPLRASERPPRHAAAAGALRAPGPHPAGGLAVSVLKPRHGRSLEQ